ncbi:MAG: hypothetical protein MdMp014T_1011 [Treponematales bacterium]
MGEVAGSRSASAVQAVDHRKAGGKAIGGAQGVVKAIGRAQATVEAIDGRKAWEEAVGGRASVNEAAGSRSALAVQAVGCRRAGVQAIGGAQSGGGGHRSSAKREWRLSVERKRQLRPSIPAPRSRFKPLAAA